jgi:hypothetical protein
MISFLRRVRPICSVIRICFSSSRLMLADPSCPWRYLEPGSGITGYTGSTAALGKVKAWLSHCLSKHDSCRQAPSSQLPTRVVKINGPTEVMLHTPTAEHAIYACLSHRWGDKPVALTTTDTLKQYSVSIPWKNLPTTFQHAIQFTYGLGIHYLWIDSLCRLSFPWQYEPEFLHSRLTVN